MAKIHPDITITSAPPASDAIALATLQMTPRKTKAALLRAMPLQPAGASLQGIMAATHWQAHTMRAALSGLRKAGVEIIRTTSKAGSVYKASAHIDAAATPDDDKGTKPRARGKYPTASNISTHRSASKVDATKPEVPL